MACPSPISPERVDATFGRAADWLVTRGVTPNIASFVGATTVRIHEVGYEDREPTAEELARMEDLVRAAMREGALGVGSSLIYAPAFYAKTPELAALAKAAGETPHSPDPPKLPSARDGSGVPPLRAGLPSGTTLTRCAWCRR